MNRTKAIMEFCLQCCNGSIREVKNCGAQDCFLYPFRLGYREDVNYRQDQKQRKQAATK